MTPEPDTAPEEETNDQAEEAPSKVTVKIRKLKSKAMARMIAAYDSGEIEPTEENAAFIALVKKEFEKRVAFVDAIKGRKLARAAKGNGNRGPRNTPARKKRRK